MVYNNQTFKSGDQVHCRIESLHIEGFIHVCGSRLFICHDNPNKSGSESPVMYGCGHSWTFSCFDDRLTEGVSDLMLLSSIPTKSLIIEEKLRSFFDRLNLPTYSILFRYDLAPFIGFNDYKISSVDGCITMTNGKKVIEIKLSRFIRQMVLKYNSFSEKSKIDINDQIVEQIHNKFIAYQKDDSLQIQIFSGKEILDGYRSDRLLHSEGGTIGKSCMMNRLDYLGIYSENPKQVELATILFGDRIVARSLIWAADDGKKYSDRVYFHYDWLEYKMIEGLEKLGISPITSQFLNDVDKYPTVSIDTHNFELYPYLDTLCYLREDGKLSAVKGRGETGKYLRSTSGRSELY